VEGRKEGRKEGRMIEEKEENGLKKKVERHRHIHTLETER